MSTVNPINWEVKSFEGLTNKELYNILKLRSEVFVVEQNCPYLDMDGKDIYSFHLKKFRLAGLLHPHRFEERVQG